MAVFGSSYLMSLLLMLPDGVEFSHLAQIHGAETPAETQIFRDHLLESQITNMQILNQSKNVIVVVEGISGLEQYPRSPVTYELWEWSYNGRSENVRDAFRRLFYKGFLEMPRV